MNAKRWRSVALQSLIIVSIVILYLIVLTRGQVFAGDVMF